MRHLELISKMGASALLALTLLCSPALSAFAGSEETAAEDTPDAVGNYLCFADDEPTTMDPQCTTEYYTIPLNVFDRLVEVQAESGSSRIVPSLASAFEISPDGLTYTFHLRPGVLFSNGEALTSEDVEYTLTRLLTHPDSCNQDLAVSIRGAGALMSGEAASLEGFRVIDELNFEITLEHPYAPFLACLSTPGASILDRESTERAGDAFGNAVESTVGTGSYILSEWKEGEEILLKANKDCWAGAPGCEGLRMLFLSNTVSLRALFEKGILDILDLDTVNGPEAEYFVHGDIYRSKLRRGSRVGITYIALNESIEPLTDVRVRKALQLALDRTTLMKAIVSGRGNVENGIFPHGLLGYNRDLEEIPFDTEAARTLLEEAGLADGFVLDLYCTEGSKETDRDLMEVLSYMWSSIGVRTRIVPLSSQEFLSLRQEGKLSAYISTWSADFNDPDNFIYTFFGTKKNTVGRSLCYPDEEVMDEVIRARSIVDVDERIACYQALEKKIIQEDAAWIPLYSRQHLFLVSDRVSGFQVAWNGWSSTSYRNVSVSD